MKRFSQYKCIPDKINFPKIESKKESRENFKQMAFFHFKGFSTQNKESDHFKSFSYLFNTIVTLNMNSNQINEFQNFMRIYIF